VRTPVPDGQDEILVADRTVMVPGLGGKGWDLCLYLLQPRHDLMRTNPGRRFQCAVVHRSANPYLSDEDLAQVTHRMRGKCVSGRS
jgi:hypothetical protein